MASFGFNLVGASKAFDDLRAEKIRQDEINQKREFSLADALRQEKARKSEFDLKMYEDKRQFKIQEQRKAKSDEQLKLEDTIKRAQLKAIEATTFKKLAAAKALQTGKRYIYNAKTGEYFDTKTGDFLSSDMVKQRNNLEVRKVEALEKKISLKDTNDTLKIKLAKKKLEGVEAYREALLEVQEQKITLRQKEKADRNMVENLRFLAREGRLRVSDGRKALTKIRDRRELAKMFGNSIDMQTTSEDERDILESIKISKQISAKANRAITSRTLSSLDAMEKDGNVSNTKPGFVMMIAPDGRELSVPQDKVSDLIRKGAKVKQ